jgi:predicted DNA-binding transcriptional regulator
MPERRTPARAKAAPRREPAAPAAESGSPLAALGIHAEEDQLYRLLLEHGPATVEDVVHALRLAPRRAQRLLDAIESKGLATHSPERPRRYLAASPEYAIEAMIRQRQAHLERARALIPALKRQAARAPAAGDREQMVELLTSRDAERQVFDQMHHLAQQEIVTLMRPPMRVTRLDVPFDEDQRHQLAARLRGVHYRSIVDAGYLGLPGAGLRVRQDVEAGEDVRVFPSLPFKLVLADRRIALIPLDLEQPGSPSLLVRSSALLDALYALFESLWERSTPVAFTGAGELRSSAQAARLPREAADLVPLLSAGLNDKTIAHELGISASTLNRRLALLMKALDTRTRFQMGWRAALDAGAAPRTSVRRPRKPPAKDV